MHVYIIMNVLSVLYYAYLTADGQLKSRFVLRVGGWHSCGSFSAVKLLGVQMHGL
jgi:hypothetical protein